MMTSDFVGTAARRRLAAVYLGLATVVLGVTGAGVRADPPLRHSGRLLVRPYQEDEFAQHGVPPSDCPGRAAAARQRLSPMQVRVLPELDLYVVAVQGDDTEDGVAAELMGTGDYAYVHPDWLCAPASTPNDPLYPNQWHHVRMQSAQAWDLTTGSAAVVCAFVDTGVDLTHPDLAPALVPGYNCVDRLTQAQGGDVSDNVGHGTQVAGAAAAVGNNGVGVAGMGWNLGIMPVRTSNLSTGAALLEDIIHGACWAAAHGAKVVSVSYTGVQVPAVESAGAYIRSVGGLLFYAADNSGTDWSGFSWPDVTIVGATDQNDDRAGFSSYGHAVDLFAPGVNILTTHLGGTYASVSGTSISTPLAAGAAAMIWSINPGLTPGQAELALLQSCDDLGTPGPDDTFGWGRVNLFRAVRLTGPNGGCVGDLNGDGRVDMQDYLVFLERFSSGDPSADIDRNGVVTGQDFLAYLGAYAAGCP
jgi:thermitase